MQTAILTLHVLVAAGIIGLVLLQHGKGADMGAAFGGGSAGSLFGATGSANFLSRATALLTAVFFATSLGLTYLSAGQSEEKGVMTEVLDQPSTSPVPAVADEGAATSGREDSRAKEIPK